MAPGALRGRMNAETQTFVSTTTRRSGSPHFVDRGRNSALDVVRVPARLVHDPTTANEQRIETANPLVPVETTDTLLAEPWTRPGSPGREARRPVRHVRAGPTALA